MKLKLISSCLSSIFLFKDQLTNILSANFSKKKTLESTHRRSVIVTQDTKPILSNNSSLELIVLEVLIKIFLKILKKTKKRLNKCGYKDEEVDKIINKTVTKEYQKNEGKKENNDKQTHTVSFQYGNGCKAL